MEARNNCATWTPVSVSTEFTRQFYLVRLNGCEADNFVEDDFAWILPSKLGVPNPVEKFMNLKCKEERDSFLKIKHFFEKQIILPYSPTDAAPQFL